MTLPHPIFTEPDVHAMRALIAGTATSEQQRRSMRFILEQICRIYDSPYVAGGVDRETFVMVGRHQVGVLITSAQTGETLAAAQKSDADKIKKPPTRRGTRNEKPVV